LIANYNLPMKEELADKTEQKQMDILRLIKFLAIGCKPGLRLTETISKSEIITSMLQNKQLFNLTDIAKRAGITLNRITSFVTLKNMFVDPMLCKIFAIEKPTKRTVVYTTLGLGKSFIEKQLGEEYCQEVFNYCALKLYEKLPDLPWRDEVVNIYKKLRGEN